MNTYYLVVLGAIRSVIIVAGLFVALINLSWAQGRDSVPNLWWLLDLFVIVIMIVSWIFAGWLAKLFEGKE